MALEPRMMFDGAAVAEATVVIKEAGPDIVDAPATPAESPSAPAASEIVFVDGSLPNAGVLAANVRAGAQVVVLDPAQDGLRQIQQALSGRAGLTGLHILSHGEAASFTLGNSRLDLAALQSNASLLQEIGTHLSADADILLYGCDIGGGADGEALVSQLAQLTQADVAASTDATGAAAKGGDWTLERQIGAIQAAALSFDDTVEPFVLGTPVVSSVDDTTYTEGSGAMVVDSSITVTGGGSYDGKYVRFSLTNGQNTDVLALNSAADVNASGAISVSGASVYLGNGSGRDIIGTIDSTENGQNGQALKINFVSTFTNSSFESGTLTGWTAMNQVVDLGATVIAGFTSPTDTTNPGNSGGNDNDVPTTPGTFTTTPDTSQKTDGSYSLRLLSSGMTTRYGYDVVHGPAVYSDAFSATAGDAIYFDWRAYAGSDAYDVYGYILNTATGATTKVLDATGNSSSASTAWATASATIPTTGNYRFVFVSGTYDYSGGRAAGASLYIDNVRVFGSKVNDAVVTSIARQVTFQATSDSPATSPTRVFTVTAMSSTNASASDTGLINVTAVNDAPTLSGAAQTLNYAENAAATPIDTAIVVADPDSPSNFNGGYLQAQITTNGLVEDQLSVRHQGTGAGQIGVSGSTISYGGTTIGTIDASYTGANNTALRINLNSNATAAAVQALARNIAYSNASDAPSTSARTVTFTMNDGGNSGTGSALSATRTATVNVTAVEDPAVLTLSVGSQSYTENDGSFFLDPNLTLTDADSATLDGAKVVISSNYASGEDRLIGPGAGSVSGTRTTYTYANAGQTITMVFDTVTGVMTLSGTASVANYQAALRAVKYYNTSDNPSVAARGIDITLGSTVMLNFGGKNHYYEFVSANVTWSAAKAGAAARSFQGLTGYLATITSQSENDFIRDKLQANAWIGASDSYTQINAATGTTTYADQNAAEGHWYWVSGPEAGTRISDGNNAPVTYSGGYANWNSGEPNNVGGEHYGEIYSVGSVGKWNDLPDGTGYGVSGYVVEYSDTGGSTPAFSKSLTITPVRVNDAPVSVGARTLTGVNEDATANSGQLVSGFLSASDPDTAPVTGIAITSLTSSRGTWQYSIDNGATWTAVGAVSDASALLLRDMDRVRFVPDGLNADSAAITYRAWDRTNENGTTVKAGQKVDVGTNGGTAAYASGTQTGNITVSAVNDAPTLTAANPTLTGINEDATANAGQTLASVLGASMTDIDTGAAQGVAITALNSGNGTWEYSTNAGGSWAAVGSVAVNSALLLRSTDLIRFKPDGKNATSASFSYKAWDQTSGSAGSKVDTTVSGGTAAFSTASDTASISVSAINDAPVLGTPSNLTSISEDAVNNAGQTVASFLSSSLTDVDAGAVQGIAITASTAVGTGKWQYSTDGGTSWFDVSNVAPATALLLRATDRVRFNPDAYLGGTATLTVRGWDTTTGVATNGATRGTADTTTNGGTTAYSSSAATVSITVSEGNDSPQFADASGTPAGPSDKTFSEVAAPAAASTSTPTVLDSTLLVADDGTGASIRVATVRVITGFTSGDVLAVQLDDGTLVSPSGYLALGTVGGASRSAISAKYDATSGLLTLGGNATAADYQAVLRAVVFKSTSENPTGVDSTRTLVWRIIDTGGKANSATTNTITITGSNDAPVVGSLPGSALAYTEGSSAIVAAPALTLSDVDDTQLSSATVRISAGTVSGDTLAIAGAALAGTGISVDGVNSTATQLVLVGDASVATYQNVLRQVTFTSSSGNPTTDGSSPTRTLTWTVVDADSSTSGANKLTSTAQTSSISVTPRNTAPTLSVSGTPTYVEKTGTATLAGSLSLADVDDANLASAKVWISTGLTSGDTLAIDTTGLTANQTTLASSASYNAASGTLTLTGSAAKADYEAVLQHVVFSSTSDDPTRNTVSRSVSWQVTDADATTAGGNKLSSSIGSSTLTITPTADAPTISGTPATWSYTEDDGTRIVAPSLSLADLDDINLSGATVIVAGNGYVNDGYELLAAVTTGTSIVASFDGATGTLSLSGADSVANYQKVLRSVTYTNTRDYNNPSAVAPNDFTLDGTTNTRTFSWQVTDANSDGASGSPAYGAQVSTVATTTVTLYNANETPQVTNITGNAVHISYTEGGAPATLEGALTVHDDGLVSSINAAFVRVTAGLEASDELGFYNAGALLAQGWTLAGSATSGTLTNGGKTIGYEWSLASGDMTFTTLAGATDQTDYTNVMQLVGFRSTSDDPTASNGTRTLIWRVTDSFGEQSAVTAAQSTIIDLTAVNDASTVSGMPANGDVAFTEDGGDVTAATGIALSDPDDTRLASATITISGAGFVAAKEYLSLPGVAVTAGADWTANNVGGSGIDASYVSATGVLTLTSASVNGVSMAGMEALLRQVRYGSSDDHPTATAGTRTLTWTVTDVFGSRLTDADGGANDAAAGDASTPNTSTITLTPVNDAPTLTASATVSYVEAGAAATLDSGITLADVDDSMLSSARVWISGGFTAGDALAANVGATGITASYDSDNGMLTLSGNASAANYQTVLRTVAFTSSSDDPTAAAASRTISWQITDADAAGTGKLTSSAGTTTVNITAANDAPTLTPAAGATFSESGSSIIANANLALADPDDTQTTGATVAISGSGFDSATEYLSFTGATLASGSVGPNSDWTATNVLGSGIDASFDHATGTLTLSGTQTLAAYQTLLRQVNYGNASQDPLDRSGGHDYTTRTLTWTVTDDFASRLTDFPAGNDADATKLSSSNTSTITIAPSNNAPTISGGLGGTASYTEGAAAATLSAGIALDDVDDADISQARVWISGGFTAGDTLDATLSNGITKNFDSTTGILTLTHATSASKAAFETVLRSVVFSSSSNDPTASAANRTISWQVTDADASTSGADKLVSAIGTSSVALTATDDVATMASLGAAAYTENGSAVAVAPSATLGDQDDNTLSGLNVTITSGKTAGDLLSVTADLTGTGITAVAYDATTGTLQLTGTAALADYESALRSIVFASSSDDPTGASASRTLTWSTVSSFGSRATDASGANDGASGVTAGNAGTSTINLTALNDAPAISLDDGTVDATDAPTFEQGGTPIFALHMDNSAGGVTLADADSADQIASASVQISANGLATDTLSIATPAGWTLAGNTYSKGGANVTVSFTAGASGLLSLSGTASRADYAELLGNVRFANGSVAPTANGASRTLTWTVTDSNAAGDGARAATANSLLIIRDRNDAPTINPLSATASYTEGAANVAVPTVVITDPDPGEIVSATLTISNANAGTLSVSGSAAYNAGTGVWTITDTVANVNTALAAITFTPTTNNDQDVTIAVSVADGGEDGAGTAAGTLTLDVTAVNDAPVLAAANPALSTINEDAVSDAGQTVASFRGAATDPDTGAQFGIAITSLASGNGAWQYSLDDGSTWSAVGAVSANSALVLRDIDRVRFVPNAQNATTASFNYRAWDRTGGAAGSKLDASNPGNASAFSVVSDTVSVTVTAVNDAPVMVAAAPTLTALTEDDRSNAGHTVASVLGGSVSDVDAGAVQGIAITSLVSGNGTWEYSLDGTTWNAVGSVADTSALLLRGTDAIRFVPDGRNATNGSFTYRAWDETSGAAGSKVDTSAAGATTAFSTVTDTASVAVSAVNDAPVLNSASPALLTITEDEIGNSGQTVASFIGATIGDVDSGAVQGIAITASASGNGHWEYSLDGGGTWTAVGTVANTSALLLRDTDRVRFMPNAENATTASLDFRAWDRTSGTAGNKVDTSINADATAFSGASDTVTIVVTAVNDVPLNDAVPAYAGAARGDGSLRQDGVITIDPGQWHDVDIGAPSPTFSYQWQIADDAAGTNLRDLTGEQAQQLLLTSEHVGKYVRAKVIASDGTGDSAPAYSSFNRVTNIDPVTGTALASQRATEAVPFNYVLPGDAFTDANAEDTLHYTATLADGSPLPDWLVFDAATLTFSGTPTGRDIAQLTIRVTADDRGGHPASATFALDVAGVPQSAPVMAIAEAAPAPEAAPLAELSSITSNKPSSGDQTGVATQDTFQAPTSGRPVEALAGTTMPQRPLAETSIGGMTRAEGFRVVVPADAPQEPMLLISNPPGEVVTKSAAAMRYVLPADTFTHSRPEAVVELTATLTNGARLPAWVKFDATKGQFSGTPPAQFSGDVEVSVTARDNFGNEKTIIMRIRVQRDDLPRGKASLSTQIRLAAEGKRPAERTSLVRHAGNLLRAMRGS